MGWRTEGKYLGPVSLMGRREQVLFPVRVWHPSNLDVLLPEEKEGRNKVVLNNSKVYLCDGW